ncbi:MAG: nuclear transport factor 2 family protein [Actinomycetota bacterium]
MRRRLLGIGGIGLGIGLVIALAATAAAAGSGRGQQLALTEIPSACWAAAADGSISDFDASAALLERCTTDDYSFAVVNPALGEIVCFRDEGFCPLTNPELSNAAVRISGFAAGAARGETGSRHQISNLVVESRSSRRAVLSFRTTAYYFNEDGSFELGWGDHTLELVKQDRRWKILNEDVFIPFPNQRLVADHATG